MHRQIRVPKSTYSALMKNKLWTENNGQLVEKIRVFFCNELPVVRFRANQLDTGTIIDLLGTEWNCKTVEDKDGRVIGEHVPGFEKVARDTLAHICVRFECKLWHSKKYGGQE